MDNESTVSASSIEEISAALPATRGDEHQPQRIDAYWYQCLGPKFCITPTKGMLSEGGESRLRWVSLHGESKQKCNRPPARWINYNEEYVIQWLAHSLGDIFREIDRARFLRLYTAAKNSAKG